MSPFVPNSFLRTFFRCPHDCSRDIPQCRDTINTLYVRLNVAEKKLKNVIQNSWTSTRLTTRSIFESKWFPRELVFVFLVSSVSFSAWIHPSTISTTSSLPDYHLFRSLDNFVKENRLPTIRESGIYIQRTYRIENRTVLCTRGLESSSFVANVAYF